MPEANPLGEAIAKAARDDMDNRPRGKVVVPEWKVDGEPAVIYFRAMTFDEKCEIRNYRSDEGADAFKYQTVRAVILKAEDADGKRLFTYDHERVFLNSAFGAVMRIAAAIAEGPTVEQAEKNSAAIPSA